MDVLMKALRVEWSDVITLVLTVVLFSLSLRLLLGGLRVRRVKRARDERVELSGAVPTLNLRGQKRP